MKINFYICSSNGLPGSRVHYGHSQFIIRQALAQQCKIAYVKQHTPFGYVFVISSEGDEIGLSVIVDKVDASNESISEATHSHSYGNDRLSQGDINLADKVHKKSPSAKLFIYDRIRYNFYNEESQYDTLPELIVKPEPKPEPEP